MTPPLRSTPPMPGIDSNSLVTVSSMYQLSCSTVMSLVIAEKFAMSLSVVSTRPICGSRMPSGRLERICVIASRRSLTARSMLAPILSWRTVGRIALLHGRAQFVDALDAARRGLDALGDLRLQLARRGARLADRDIGDREIDVRVVVDVQPHEADDAGERQRQEQHDRRHRVADRPGGDVAKAHASVRISSPAVVVCCSTGFTFCPGDRNAPAATDDALGAVRARRRSTRPGR